MKLPEIISSLNMSEKFALLTGKDNWRTTGIERVGIPSITVSDGPHGLRKVEQGPNGEEATIEAVCFPTLASLAATWNPDLVRKVGKALGEECGAMGVDVILGPGVNIKRTPLCGRNFEYFSEDPLLAGELAAAYVDGVQSMNVGTSLKHFAANNQEFDRLQINSEIDSRTLREIYLKPFEIAVKKSQPWTVMCAYNRLNGIYCCENRSLLNDLLKEEWGFQGFVVSDWRAVHDRVKSLKAGLELEMPFNPASAAALQAAYQRGEIGEAEIDAALERLLNIVFRAVESRNKRPKTYDPGRHHELAKEAALEGITLLKNEPEILPINKRKVKRILVVGELAEKPVIQGDGSAHVKPLKVDSPLEQLKKLAGAGMQIDYYPVFHADQPTVDRLNYALEASQNADLVLIFAGNRQGIEGEFYDRSAITLAPEMERVISSIASQNPNTAVIVEAGSAIDMSAWINQVKVVVFAWYGGQAMGSALAEILFGLANPSGKIAETFPLKIEDTPAFGSHPGNGFTSPYKEGIMVGYRYYDTYHREVLFPFGHGLSYTTFDYSDLRITPSNVMEEEELTVGFKVKNNGGMTGKEVVQLYVRDVAARGLRPEKELKAFAKVELRPGEEREVQFKLNREAFAYFNTSLNSWLVESGEFLILVGSSSRDIRLPGRVRVDARIDFS